MVGPELQAGGFGGLWAVGKAAAEPPALVVLSYTPADATETVALVGKGAPPVTQQQSHSRAAA